MVCRQTRGNSVPSGLLVIRAESVESVTGVCNFPDRDWTAEPFRRTGSQMPIDPESRSDRNLLGNGWLMTDPVAPEFKLIFELSL